MLRKNMRASVSFISILTALCFAGGVIYLSVSTTYDAVDSFDREVTNGWGSAKLGGRYSIVGRAADFNVNRSAGKIMMSASNMPDSAYLLGVSALNVDITFRVETDKLVAGSGQIAAFVARYVGNGSDYVGRLRLRPDGSVWLQAAQELGGQVALLGAERVVPDVTHIANRAIWVRGQVVGTNPTTIRLKAWADGQSEPANWLYSVTDIATGLQTAGAVGLRAYLSPNAINTLVEFSFDDFQVTSIDASDHDEVIDTFSRRVAEGWGGVGNGHSYTIAGSPANFAVDGSAGTIAVPVNVPQSAYLTNVSALNTNVTFQLRTDKLPVEGGQLAYFMVRQVSSGTAYLGRVRFTPTSSVWIQAVMELNGKTTLLGAERLAAGVSYSVNRYIWVRGQVVGTNPTTIRLKAWADGQAEPGGWQYSITDETPALQAAGTVGLRAYLSPAAINAPVRFTFDNFRVTNITTIAEP
jgi:hypothetical protein